MPGKSALSSCVWPVVAALGVTSAVRWGLAGIVLAGILVGCAWWTLNGGAEREENA